MPRPTPPHDPQHSPSAPASPGLAAPDTTAPDALAGAPTLTGAQGGPEASAWAERGGACVGQPRPQVGTTDQSALAAARSDPIPEAQLCPIKKSGWYALPIRSWRSVPGVGKEPGRKRAAVGGARA